MDKTRILPPLVRGRVTGILDFFVDEIRLARNILLLTDKFDLVLQVQWWGEVLPALIRPKKLNVEGKTSTRSYLLESYYHSAQYEIKTTLDLFKTYLKNCEVLELCVLEAFEHYVIGSAFLKDLIDVLFSNNKLIRMPIFDYLGEEIGEVIIHVNFLEKSHPEKNNKFQNKSGEILGNIYVHKKMEDCSISNKISSDVFTLGEKTILYDGHSKKSLCKVEAIVERGLPINLHDFKKSEHITNSNLSLPISDTSNNLFSKQESKIKNRLIGESKEPRCLPEIQALSDSSKVLYFGATSQQSKIKTDRKKTSTKITSKFNSNSIKCKSKHSERLSALCSEKQCKKSITKKTECSKNVLKNTTKAKRKESDFNVSSMHNKFFKSEIETSNELPEFRNIPSKCSPNVNVLDYLLGSDMSKEDEQTALDDFKNMSPSHNLVDSINQLCIISDKHSEKSMNKGNDNASAPQKQTVLNFDFNNPIERTYYKTFFLKSNSPADFEIAELLNQPPNNFFLGKFDENARQENETKVKKFKNVNKFSFPNEETIGRTDKDYLNNFTDRRNSCARCKYYKKLNELDTIIESLKHFEQKMLSHEKDLQSAFRENSDKLIKRNHN